MRWISGVLAVTGIVAALAAPLVIAKPAQAHHGGGFHGGGFHGGFGGFRHDGFRGFRGHGFSPFGFGFGYPIYGYYPPAYQPYYQPYYQQPYYPPYQPSAYYPRQQSQVVERVVYVERPVYRTVRRYHRVHHRRANCHCN